MMRRLTLGPMHYSFESPPNDSSFQK